MIGVLKSRNRPRAAARKTTILLLLSVVFFFALAGEADAQRRFSRTYPAGKNVKLALTNRSGTVTVVGWNRPEVAISAYLEPPAAVIEPQSLSGVILINCVRDNQGRGEVGSVNFEIRVPFDASVDLETKIGNLSVTNVRGYSVRASITTDGDITLSNISAFKVSADNGIGNIFFDGDVIREGQYRFSSMQGDINLRIPIDASFRFVATAPSTKRIAIGGFSSNLRTVGDGRRIVGQNGDGSASLSVVNQRGTISFLVR
jgi:hypothetical protein